MQLSYNNVQGRGYAGELASIGPYKARVRVYANQTHRVDVSVDGSTDGVREITIASDLLPDGPVTVSHTASGLTADALTTALADAINTFTQTVNGVPTYPLRNILRATGNTTDDDVELVAARSGENFTVTFGGAQAGELSQTTVVDANVADIPYGIALVDVDGDTCRLPAPGDTDALLLGIAKRGKQLEAADDNSGEMHDAGDSLEIVHETSGEGIYIMPEDDLAVGGAVFVRLTAGAGEQAGAFRSDADGGDAIAFTGVRVTKASDVANGVPAALAMNRA